MYMYYTTADNFEKVVAEGGGGGGIQFVANNITQWQVIKGTEHSGAVKRCLFVKEIFEKTLS